MANLVSCPECQRHIRQTETVCPFCERDVGARIASVAPRPLPTMRLSRAALYAFAAAATVGTAACSSDDGNPTPMYGAPAPTGGQYNAGGSATGGQANTGGTATGGQANTGGTASGGQANTGGQQNTGGGIAPAYGVPASGGFGGAAIYGAPPVPTGQGGAIYGAPPVPTATGAGGAAVYGAPPTITDNGE